MKSLREQIDGLQRAKLVAAPGHGREVARQSSRVA